MTNACTRQECHEFLRAEIQRRATKLTAWLDNAVPRVLKKHGVTWHENEPGHFDEVALNAAKDLEKLAIYQSEDVDQHKQFGYVCFWIRKLKPVKVAFLGDGKSEQRINELLSIWLACELAITDVELKGEASALPETRSLSAQVSARINRFMGDRKTIEYIVHCMRARTFGPHHYVLMLKQITIA